MVEGDVSVERLLEAAEQAAREAGRYAFENRHRRLEVNHRTHHDVKLKLDEETQDVSEACIRRSFPEHSIFGEEGGELDREAKYLWIVDPIDGSINFMQGLPYWCTSVAVMHGGEVVAGAVYAAEQDECFTASIDGEALRNGKVIRVSELEDLRSATVCVAGLSQLKGDQRDRLLRLLDEAGKVRVFGAAALDLCYVACGRFDAIYEIGLKLWDVAAGGLIARRAGGAFEQVEKKSELAGSFICSNGAIQKPLRELLRVS